MKKTKKLLACLIAVATMFTMGSTAFAADAGTTYTDQSTVTIKKAYKLTSLQMREQLLQQRLSH